MPTEYKMVLVADGTVTKGPAPEAKPAETPKPEAKR